MTQLVAYLVSAALFAFAIALLLAGRSLFVAARLIVGWLAALAALALGLLALATLGFEKLVSHGPVSGSLIVCGSALIALGVAARLFRPARPPQLAGAAHAPSTPSAPAPRAQIGPLPAAIEDAQGALVGLGYTARDARAAVKRAVATLGPGADASAIVKTALRSRT